MVVKCRRSRREREYYQCTKKKRSNGDNYCGISVTCTFSHLYLKELMCKEYDLHLINKEIRLMFENLSKAYGSVPVIKLWKVLDNTNITDNVIGALKELYKLQMSQVEPRNYLANSFAPWEINCWRRTLNDIIKTYGCEV